MAEQGRATTELLSALGQALAIQSEAVDHGTHFGQQSIPENWDPNLGQFVPCPRCLKPVRGVIAHLRYLAGDKNPSEAGLIKATASSSYVNRVPENVTDWNLCKGWSRALLSERDSWLQLDFLDKRVIVRSYTLHAWGKNKDKVKTWSLDGRNSEAEPWENIDRQPQKRSDPDGPLDGHEGPVVFPSSKPNNMYRYLRFSRLTFGPGRQQEFPAVEFFGALLILKNPPGDPVEPETAS